MARPREFDEDLVLQAALGVFWDKGYEGTSLSDLMEAMKLTKSSLYKAFGSKEELFWRVVERYQRDFLDFRNKALAEPTPRRIAEQLLNGAIEVHTGGMNPVGCLVLNSSVAGSAGSDSVRKKLICGWERFQEQLRDRFEETKTAAPLPPGMSSDDAASLVITLIQGLAVQAKAGASRESVRSVVRSVLLLWPES